MSREVGFTFQGDVFMGGSLVISSTGRLLKALSDGGVDVYALAMVLELGKRIPIGQHHETVVSRAMAKRACSRQGFLARALSVGWGHNDMAYELSRTRGGCAALLMLNAFATGPTTFVAAQGLQTMVSLMGCETGLLPTVDSIQAVVKHLDPIMLDSGFAAVFETIRAGATAELRKLLRRMTGCVEEECLLQDTKQPREWAELIHQLILTSQEEESIYVPTRARAAWIAAFAVFILEMRCTILHGSDVIWAAAGRRGCVTLQISIQARQPPVQFERVFELIPETLSPVLLNSTYTLRDALGTELLALPDLATDIQLGIKYAIVRVLSTLAASARWVARSRSVTPMVGSFGNLHTVVVSVCQSLGIELDDVEAIVQANLVVPFRTTSARFKWQDSLDSWLEDLLGPKIVSRLILLCTCSRHYHPEQDEDNGTQHFCLLLVVNQLISSFAAVGVMLLPCVYDSSTVRVYHCHTWREGEYDPDLMWDITDGTKILSLEQIFLQFSTLVHTGGIPVLSESQGYVTVSGQGSTIAFRALFEEDAFDSTGKYLAIYHGRLSSEGCFRDLVIEGNLVEKRKALRTPWSLAEKTPFDLSKIQFVRTLQTHTEVSIEESRFRIDCQIFYGSDTTLSKYEPENLHETRKGVHRFCLTSAVGRLLRAETSLRCGHHIGTAFTVPKSESFTSIMAGFPGVDAMKSCCTFVPTPGSRFEQLLSIYLTGMPGQSLNRHPAEISRRSEKVYVLLQEGICLSCAYNHVEAAYRVNLCSCAVIICPEQNIGSPSRLE